MKLRDSGMPDEAYWESLFDTELILNSLEIDAALGDVIELGCGYGTFSVSVAKRISGRLLTYDIDPEMAARTTARAREAKLDNVSCLVRDVFADGFGVEDASQDACLLFNILHCENPAHLLIEAARVVRPGGHVLAIHWRCDIATPRGPSLDIRPQPEHIVDWARDTRLLTHDGRILTLPPWHYGLRLTRV
ncbi:MAG: class I SAM-dependent methyltransferase [Candidatus Hydrogenedentes bacterium]|nr:class I SAM-dependent methyltransferase [Candidatus Hydrogenedentota bacterium]